MIWVNSRFLGWPLLFWTRISHIFTNILCWARSQANSRKRLTNRTNVGHVAYSKVDYRLLLSRLGRFEAGFTLLSLLHQLVASSDAFILHVLNKNDSPDSLVDYCLLLSRLGRVEASFTLRSLLHQFVFLHLLPKVEFLITINGN